MMTKRKIKAKGGVIGSKSGFSRHGFSLIEVLISLGILSVGLLAVAQMQVAAIKGISFSRHMTSATYLARQQMEYLRGLPYDDTNPTVAPKSSATDFIYAKGPTGNVTPFLDDLNGTGPSGACGDVRYGSTLENINNPVDEQGNPAGAGGVQGGQYYVIWKVRRGLTDVCTGVTAIGPGQMSIEMQVIWWESEKDKPAALDLSSTSWDALRATHANRVVLTTLRQQNL